MSMSGEMLGEKTQEKLFGLLLKREENQACAECKAKAPTWVSLDFGVFVCMNCSGAHRHLSRNVTRVYSTKIDSWNKSNFQIMDHVGNEIANSYWEFYPPTKRIAVNAQPDERVRFVTDKYMRKLYANPKSQNPVLTFLDAREKGILKRPYQNKENQLATPTINSINDKEFLSNGAAGSMHTDLLKEQQKKLIDKKQFISMNSPSTKPAVAVVSLLDDDLDFLPFENSAQGQQPKQQISCSQNDHDDNTFSNFMLAPAQNQTKQQGSSSSSLLDMYSNLNHHKIHNMNGIANNAGQIVMNTTAMGYNNNNNSSMNPNLVAQQINTTNGCQLSPNLQSNFQYNHMSKPNTVVSTSSTGNGYNPSARINTSACDGSSTDLMSLYSKSSNNGNAATYTANNLSNIPVNNLPSNPQQSGSIQPVDKNRFSALNSMNQYGNNSYYPYYPQQQQQQQQQCFPGMMPIQQNYQWK